MSFGKKIAPLLLLTISLAVSLIAAELILRIFFPYSAFGTGKKLKFMKNVDIKNVWTIDPDFGFRPILGNDNYNKYGTKVNQYTFEKRPGVTRLLFMGDSATARGKIINGIKHYYGEGGFEYWNAGVDGFNTVQEVRFYEKYNRPLKPDHVILTFHLNDFETTPVVFLNKENQLMVYAPKIPAGRINKYLFKNSCLYRLFLSARTNLEIMMISKKEIDREVTRYLAELKESLSHDGAELTVLIHPRLEPYKDWPVTEKASYDKIIKILRELKIRYFDMKDVFDKAISDKIDMREVPNDPAHPSDKMGLYFGEYLYNKGLLKK